MKSAGTGVLTGRTFGEAYVDGLNALLERGARVPGVRDARSVGSAFGLQTRATLELIGYSFEVADPTSNLIVSQSRPIRPSYCVGLFLWTMAGSDDEAWIRHYNPRSSDFSDDGQHLSAAFGKRLFANAGVDQVAGIMKKLSADPSSRRTVATISIAADNAVDSRDYPCAIALQFFERNEALQAVAFMRSQSALMVLPFDGFLFMSLQCWIAAQLGLRVGTYRHIVGSFHIYEDELERARRVVEEGVESVKLGDASSNVDDLDQLLQFERELRVDVREGRRGAVEDTIGRTLRAIPGDSTASFSRAAKLVLLTDAASRLELAGGVAMVLEALPRDLRDVIKATL